MPTTPTNSDSSGAQVTNQINTVARDVQALQTTQIFKDDTGTRRVLLGKGADGFYGLKVSQSGTDVYDASDDDLIFNSSQNVFKIVNSGTVGLGAVTAPGSSTVTITHNLGYRPIVVAYVDLGTYSVQMPYLAWSAGGVDDGKVSQTFNILLITNSTVQFGVQIGSLSADLPATSIKYYLLQEIAN